MSKRKRPLGGLLSRPALQPGGMRAKALPQAMQQAVGCYRRGELAEAERLCRDLIEVQADNGDALSLLGQIARQTGRIQEAIELLSSATRVNPLNVHAHSILGNVLSDCGRYQEAVSSYDCVIKLKPGHADAHYNRGTALCRIKRHAEALESFDRVLRLDPANVEAWINRGVALQELKRVDAALESYDRALQLHPDSADAHYNRGNALRDVCRFSEALHHYDQAVAIRPDFVDGHIDRVMALLGLARYAEALQSAERAVSIQPDHAKARLNWALCLLLTGDFERGWTAYESRWQTEEFRARLIKTSLPEWDGRPLAGPLLVWNEQGVGDEIFYAGMLRDLMSHAAKVTLCVDRRLVPVMQRSFGEIQVMTGDALRPDMGLAAHLPMGSLGRHLRSDFNAIENGAQPYLKADATRAHDLRARLAKGGRILCGLSWQSKNPLTGPHKTLRIEDLAPVLQLPGIDFVDLQYGDTAPEQAQALAITGRALLRAPEIDNFNDLDGLAALIEACDVILTVSNTTAHLAAAIGKPVLLMLPFSMGLLWYWHTERKDSPWYPTARLFRQPATGDWKTVIENVRTELVRWSVT